MGFSACHEDICTCMEYKRVRVWCVCVRVCACACACACVCVRERERERSNLRITNKRLTDKLFRILRSEFLSLAIVLFYFLSVAWPSGLFKLMNFYIRYIYIYVLWQILIGSIFYLSVLVGTSKLKTVLSIPSLFIFARYVCSRCIIVLSRHCDYLYDRPIYVYNEWKMQ